MLFPIFICRLYVTVCRENLIKKINPYIFTVITLITLHFRRGTTVTFDTDMVEFK